MARRLEYGGGSGGVNIKKGSKFKGYIRIFCREVVGNLGESVKIDRNCQKYVGIFEVRSIEQIIPVYCYQKNK